MDPALPERAEQSPKVFISYSHDSDEHRKRVLALSERLRSDGVETVLDQYVNGTPAERWPRWMMNQLDAANHVLVVCTETYYRRFRGTEAPGQGRGVDWEGALISQEIYDGRSTTVKFVPVLFAENDRAFIPEPLRGGNYYTLTSDRAYQALYDLLLGQAGVEPGPIGVLRKRDRPAGEALRFDQQPAPAAAGSPVSAEEWYERGTRLYQANDYSAALDAFNESLRLDPGKAWAYYNRGLTRYSLDDSSDAIADFTEAVNRGLLVAMVFRNRANAYAANGDTARALDDYKKAIELDPSHPYAYFNRGWLYEQARQTPAAIDDYRLVVKLAAAQDVGEKALARLRALGAAPAEG